MSDAPEEFSDGTFHPQTAVYSPPESATYAMEALENIRKNQQHTIQFGVSGVEDYFAPMLPGQICAIIAQTSQYKSGLLHFIERQAAIELEQTNRLNEALVHVSVEECVEEQVYLELARESGENEQGLARGEVQHWDRLEAAALKVGTIPIWRIGDSLARAEDLPNLYLSNMMRAIDYLARVLLPQMGIHRIASLYFDYLQAFPFDPEIRAMKDNRNQQRRLQVREDVYNIRRLAYRYKCPAWVAIQAKQNLDGAAGPNMLIPGIYDGEETSSIAQRFDRIVQLWMPKMTHTIGSHLKHGEMEFDVEENLLWLKVGKQRGGLPSGRVWKCRVDFQHNVIAPEVSLKVDARQQALMAKEANNGTAQDAFE